MCHERGSAARNTETLLVSKRIGPARNRRILCHRRWPRNPQRAPMSAGNQRHLPSRSGRLSEALWPICRRTHRRGSAEADHPDQNPSRSALRRAPEASRDVSSASVGSHAPCAWSTKGWPMAAKERSPSSDQPRATTIQISGGSARTRICPAELRPSSSKFALSAATRCRRPQPFRTLCHGDASDSHSGICWSWRSRMRCKHTDAKMSPPALVENAGRLARASWTN